MEVHRNILQKLVDEGPIERVDSSTSIDEGIVKELHDAGLIDAIDAKSFGEPICFLNVRISMAGREWLRDASSDEISSEAPALITHLAWFRDNWRSQWKIILAAALIVLFTSFFNEIREIITDKFTEDTVEDILGRP